MTAECERGRFEMINKKHVCGAGDTALEVIVIHLADLDD